MSIEETKQKLRAAVKMIASCLEDLPRTDYLVCAITRSDDLKETSIAAIASNLCWHDREEEGRLRSPTIGMYTDMLVDAKMNDEGECFERRNWRDKEFAEENSRSAQQSKTMQ